MTLYLAFSHILYLNACDLQYLLSPFLIFFYLLCLLLCTNIQYQDKFLVCENLLGNETDSDSIPSKFPHSSIQWTLEEVQLRTSQHLLSDSAMEVVAQVLQVSIQQ